MKKLRGKENGVGKEIGVWKERVGEGWDGMEVVCKDEWMVMGGEIGVMEEEEGVWCVGDGMGKERWMLIREK